MCIALRRIQKELSDIRNSEHREIPENISTGPISENDLLHWNATICGAVGTPYEGGLFTLVITFPDNYPFLPPSIKFTTRLFHPNIHENGDICLDILKHHWSPAYSLSHVLLSISSLLSDPNPDDPLNVEAARMYKSNINQYNATVHEYVLKYAF